MELREGIEYYGVKDYTNKSSRHSLSPFPSPRSQKDRDFKPFYQKKRFRVKEYMFYFIVTDTPSLQRLKLLYL